MTPFFANQCSAALAPPRPSLLCSCVGGMRLCCRAMLRFPPMMPRAASLSWRTGFLCRAGACGGRVRRGATRILCGCDRRHTHAHRPLARNHAALQPKHHRADHLGGRCMAGPCSDLTAGSAQSNRRHGHLVRYRSRDFFIGCLIHPIARTLGMTLTAIPTIIAFAVLTWRAAFG
jgi:hypothetical protein